MDVCPRCASLMETAPFQGSRRMCPRCGADQQTVEAGPAWIDVARVTNLAEAGFLTDELVGIDIDARIRQIDELSAFNDRWASVYLIQVRNDQAYEAAAQIRQHMADEAVVEADGVASESRFSAIEEAIDPAFWRPVMLVVLAGVASFMLGQQFSVRHGQRVPLGSTLSTAVDRIGRPLVSEPVAGQPRHRLLFDRRRAAWYLDVDRDGDGLYDSRQQFHSSGAAW